MWLFAYGQNQNDSFRELAGTNSQIIWATSKTLVFCKQAKVKLVMFIHFLIVPDKHVVYTQG